MVIHPLERLLAQGARRFAGIPRSGSLAIAFIAILAVGFLDYVTGYELSLSILYLLPITIATWFGGRKIGILYALLCGLSWFVVVEATGLPFSHPWIPIWNAAVRIAFFLTHAVLLAAFRDRLRAEQTLARTDPLTGVLNSRAFREQLQFTFAVARRHGGTISFSYVDLDDFKNINDTYGHAEGDRILQMSSRCLIESTRGIDIVARLGGDEFAVLMPDTDSHGAEVVITKYANKLSKLMHSDGSSITCSIGTVSFIDLPPTGEAMITAADRLMYETKGHGGGGAVFGEYKSEACKIVKRLDFASQST